MQLQRPTLIQSQKAMMNPQLLQSIRIMELPIMELREKIEEEVDKNPALEVLEDPAIVSLDAADNPRKEEEEYFENSSDSGFISRDGRAASDEKQQFIEGVLTQPETLQDHLLWQLRLEPIDGDLRRICELLIQNLDDDGFHEVPVNELLANEESGRIQKALKVVQGLDPVGTCTANFRESLLVQIGLLRDAPDGIAEALSHLELLERGRIAEAARLMGRSETEMNHIFKAIKNLSPFPGRRFSLGDTRFVVPDIQVIKKEGEFVIILNEEEIPVLGINPFFMKIMDGKDDSEKGAAGREQNINRKKEKPVRDFARENIKEARWFINAINQRNHTLLRVSRAIVEFQRPFFTNGPKYLAPLTLADIAGELGLHETTVSRTAGGKFMQTEWGIFELRHFFSNSITGTGSAGSKYSKEGVKETVREIIESESARAGRLSDQDIVELLSKRGINIARRTVSKYRKELDLGSSYIR